MGALAARIVALAGSKKWKTTHHSLKFRVPKVSIRGSLEGTLATLEESLINDAEEVWHPVQLDWADLAFIVNI